MIASLKVPILLLGSLIALCSAKPKTNVFVYTPDAEPFQFDLLEGHYLAGTIIGLGLLGVFTIISIVMTIIDEINRHKIYRGMRADILKKLAERGYDYKEKENQDRYKAWKKAKIL